MGATDRSKIRFLALCWYSETRNSQVRIAFANLSHRAWFSLVSRVKLLAGQLLQFARFGAAVFGDGRQVLSQRADAGGEFGRIFFADDAAQLMIAGFLESFFLEGRCAGQEFVQQNAERIDVATGIEIEGM